MIRPAIQCVALALALCSLTNVSCGKKKDSSDTSSSSAVQVSDNTQVSNLTMGTASLVIPPNAVDKDTIVKLEAAADPAAIAAVYATAPKASNALTVSAKNAKGDDLANASGQLMLNIGYDDTLALTAVEKKTDNLCVLVVSQDNKQYVWRHISLGISATDKIIKLSTKYFGTYQAVYCGTETLTGFTDLVAPAPPVSTAAATELEGSWTTGCKTTSTADAVATSSRDDLVVVGDILQYTMKSYVGSSTCEDKNILTLVHTQITFTIGDAAAQPAGAKKLDGAFTGLDYTPYTVTYTVQGSTSSWHGADEFNGMTMCEISDWADGVTRDVLGKKCDSESETSTVNSGDKYYTLFTNDATRGFCLGTETADLDGSTDAKRPVAVESGTSCFKRF